MKLDLLAGLYAVHEHALLSACLVAFQKKSLGYLLTFAIVI